MATSPPGVERLPHDRSHLLCHNREAQKPTELFKESIDRWLGAIVSDDSATDSRAGVPVRGAVFAKGDGTVAGRPPIERLVGRHFPSCEIEWFVSEGGKVSKTQKILALNGPSSSVLSCERILLNLLGRMSGIATATADWVEESGDIGIACTRKTAWGLMDKWAVHVGGGLTHRLCRSDALMIKENDLAVVESGGEDDCLAIKSVVESIDLDEHASFTVLEVRRDTQAFAAAKAWSECQSNRGGDEPVTLLLDNLGPSECEKIHDELVRIGLRSQCILEGSGGVKRMDLKSWSASGVDVLSTSEVNMEATQLDVSMMVGEM